MNGRGIFTNRRGLILAALLSVAGGGCNDPKFGGAWIGEAHASATSFPDFGTMLSLTGSAIVGSGSSYATGTTFYPGATATRLSMWVKFVMDGGSGLSSGVNVQLTCGYAAASEVTIPYTWTDQDAPTLAQTQAMTGTAATTTYHLIQTAAITGAKAGCRLQARSANASAGSGTDAFTINVYGY